MASSSDADISQAARDSVCCWLHSGTPVFSDEFRRKVADMPGPSSGDEEEEGGDADSLLDYLERIYPSLCKDTWGEAPGARERCGYAPRPIAYLVYRAWCLESRVPVCATELLFERALRALLTEYGLAARPAELDAYNYPWLLFPPVALARRRLKTRKAEMAAPAMLKNDEGVYYRPDSFLASLFKTLREQKESIVRAALEEGRVDVDAVATLRRLQNGGSDEDEEEEEEEASR